MIEIDEHKKWVESLLELDFWQQQCRIPKSNSYPEVLL
jgi:hypothetical protein